MVLRDITFNRTFGPIHEDKKSYFPQKNELAENI